MSQAPRLTVTELINGGQGLVRALALRLHSRFDERHELADLIAFGQVGLAQAAASFDPEKEVQFSTYAYQRIRGAIYEGIEKMGWARRSAYRRARLATHISDAMEYFPEPPSLQETTLQEDARWFASATQQLVMVSFTALDGDGEFASNIASRVAHEPADIAAAKEIGQLLWTLVARLPDEPRELIQLMYSQGLALNEAAGRLQISKSWASRLHSRAMTRLANDLQSAGVADAGVSIA